MWLRPLKFYRTKTSINPSFSEHAVQIQNALRSHLELGENVVNRILHKHTIIQRANPEEMIKSIITLKEMNLNRTEIAAYPLVMLRTDFVLKDNQRLLMEIGLKNVTAYRLHNIQQILNNSVQFNQQFNFLPRDINILEHIFNAANVDVVIGNDVRYKRTDSLLKIHMMAMAHYFQQCLQFSNEQIVKTLSRNVFQQGRSIQGIEHSIMIAERITKGTVPTKTIHNVSLSLFPEHIESMFKLKSIYGINLQSLLQIRNACLHFPIERCLKSAEILQRYNVPEHVVQTNKSLLLRRPHDLEEDLELISSVTNRKHFFEHIYFGHLLKNIRRIKTNMDKTNMDFHKTVDEKFIDFYLNGFFFRRNAAVLPYLCCRFNVTKDKAQKAIMSHPHCKQANLLIVHQNIEFLLKQGFTYDDIFQDIYVVFYSSAEVKEFLKKLNNPTEAEKLGISTCLTKSQTLRLIVYFIEQKCGFNGEGVYLSAEQIEMEDNESVRLEAIINSCLGKKNSSMGLYDDVDENE